MGCDDSDVPDHAPRYLDVRPIHMKYETKALKYARDQFVLAVHIRAKIEMQGWISSDLVGVSLGKYEIPSLHEIQQDHAAWSLEMISTNNLAIALNVAIEKELEDKVIKSNDDVFLFIKCLRNAFAHNPYDPKWHLTDTRYRKQYVIEDGWRIDLTSLHGTDVSPQQYHHASGLLRITDLALNLLGVTKLA